MFSGYGLYLKALPCKPSPALYLWQEASSPQALNGGDGGTGAPGVPASLQLLLASKQELPRRSPRLFPGAHLQTNAEGAGARLHPAKVRIRVHGR